VRAALRRRERVDLVDDHRFHIAQRLARPRCEHEVERFRRRDEDVGGIADELLSFLARRVAGAHRDARGVERLAQPLRGERDTGQRCPEVLVDVERECTQRRDVQHARAPLFLGRRARPETVDRRQERGERLPRPRRREEQCVLALGDRGPAVRLRVGGRDETRLEPRPDGF
jgi:hypothetical protein